MQFSIIISLFFALWIACIQGDKNNYTKQDCDNCCNMTPAAIKNDCLSKCTEKFSGSQDYKTLQDCVRSCNALINVCQSDCEISCRNKFSSKKRKRTN